MAHLDLTRSRSGATVSSTTGKTAATRSIGSIRTPSTQRDATSATPLRSRCRDSRGFPRLGWSCESGGLRNSTCGPR
jgi:hypothetical protein